LVIQGLHEDAKTAMMSRTDGDTSMLGVDDADSCLRRDLLDLNKTPPGTYDGRSRFSLQCGVAAAIAEENIGPARPSEPRSPGQTIEF
jgi:hypothetical protein